MLAVVAGEEHAEFGADDEWPRRWAEAYVEQSAERVFRWLLDKEMHYLPAVNWVERGDFVPGNSVPRYHILWGTGLGLVQRFVDLLAAPTVHVVTLTVTEKGYCHDPASGRLRPDHRPRHGPLAGLLR